LRTIVIAVIIIAIVGLFAAGVSFMQSTGVQRDMAPGDGQNQQSEG
jgi:hypothetical protein